MVEPSGRIGSDELENVLQWSQLKKRIESLFADSVKGRVELRTTSYHKAPDQMGRAWITIDGQEAINMCTFAYEVTHWREAKKLQQATGCTDYRNPEHRDGYYSAHEEAANMLKDTAVFSQSQFYRSLFAYLNLSIEQIVSSPDPIVRAIGMLDRRLGKRRLAAMEMSDENSLVVRLHSFRVEAESLDVKKMSE